MLSGCTQGLSRQLFPQPSKASTLVSQSMDIPNSSRIMHRWQCRFKNTFDTMRSRANLRCNDFKKCTRRNNDTKLLILRYFGSNSVA
mmetsp:Transcript_6788/g.16669  ORF Transcript_6788/g.16669 Transcript_6788/m.16669 type:complete len:87 (+) Transcript_6788:59-319(+)